MQLNFAQSVWIGQRGSFVGLKSSLDCLTVCLQDVSWESIYASRVEGLDDLPLQPINNNNESKIGNAADKCFHTSTRR